MTATATHLPVAKDIRDMLVGLLGREVEMKPSAPLAPGPRNPSSVAVYVDDIHATRAVIACDLAFSVYAGAALALVPPETAETAIEERALDETLTENLAEVLNVAATLFNAPGSPHVRLKGMHPAGGELPVDVRLKTLTLGRREDLTVEIPGYGSGRLSFILT